MSVWHITFAVMLCVGVPVFVIVNVLLDRGENR